MIHKRERERERKNFNLLVRKEWNKYVHGYERNEAEGTKNEEEIIKKIKYPPCTCLLTYLTTTAADRPTPSSIGNPKRVSQPPTKDIISTKNRLIFVRLLMVLCHHCRRQCDRYGCHGS